MTQPLDPLRLPLYGERLIEASAGTGKTYTIAGLYLRLLLGHGEGFFDTDGQPCQHARPLSVTEILVVTFTDAATAELRGRIRARIHEARLAFLQGHSDDPLLAQLLDEVSDRPQACQRLLAGERQMDEAAIFTIHGFCQRMLKQNAFESGALFETTFLTDDSQLKLQAVSDYWRSEFYQIDQELAGAVYGWWKSPRALLQAMGRWLDNHELTILPAMGDVNLSQQHQQAMAQLADIKANWLSELDTIREQTEGHINRYTGKNYEGWLQAISQWAQDPRSGYEIPKALVRFSQTKLEEGLKKGGQVPTLPLFAKLEAFISNPPRVRELILMRAAQSVRALIAQGKRQRYQLSFDDLLNDLDGALDSALGARLCERIRSNFRVAMIDEFQDTDPQQYRIFQRLYGARNDTALLMIGDPKQAIYGFRGADIFTYIQARRNVSDHYTLSRNYRSSKLLVAAVNGLFEWAQAPFIYDSDIPFVAVDAKGKAEALYLAGEPAAVLHCWYFAGEGTTINRGDYQSQMAKVCAGQIHQLLTLAGQGQAMIGEQCVKAGDIAVLVRTGAEGKLMERELAHLGIASVYLSNRESVLSQVEAREILLILRACQNPNSERALRAALACGLFDLDASALDALALDERSWEEAVQEFIDYRALWQSQGVLAMLRALLHRRNLASALLAGSYGERRLTNYLHLAELLQQVSGELDGEYALLRWLAEAVDRPTEQQVDEQILRLESERKLVQIVTIHKSKGLEYPLVFLPFVCSHRSADTALYHDSSSHQAVLDLSQSEQAMMLADQERLAEDLRLLYVALTRAIYSCWLGLAPVRSGGGESDQTDLHLSAIGYLLQRGQAGDSRRLYSSLTDFAATCQGVVISEPSLTALTPLSEAVSQNCTPQVRQFQGKLERDWWISSYTGLSASGHQHSKGVLAAPGFDDEVAAQVTEVGSVDNKLTIFDFAKGARAGTLLHAIFEALDFSAFDVAQLQQDIEALLISQGFSPQFAPLLCQHVQAVLNTPLLTEQGECLTLAALTPAQKQPELEFFIPMARVSARALTTLCQQHDALSKSCPSLSFATVQGMLKGFIDLVFEWQGRWYVLDYKSNHLGMQSQDYQPEALTAAMKAHRYDLQYQLYSLALHRLLTLRLPDYDFERHFGGVFYLFLRGMPAHGVFYHRPSYALISALDELFRGDLTVTDDVISSAAMSSFAPQDES